MQMEPGGRLVMMVMSDRNSEEGWNGPRRTSEAEIRHNLRECAPLLRCAVRLSGPQPCGEYVTVSIH